ncbi:MAG TPA: FAD-linked oxidase C-terminal domain-containing protein [Pyrinomonadaceae bacterium]|nr:FAD-linked oxidase C-terminal domain-containing protein [Pyrinomonadaceae bacterium]
MDTLVNNLRSVLKPEQVISEPEELLVYECDGLTHYRHRPRAVVFPASTDEVARVVRLVTEAGVPLVPRGAGTGLSGGALAVGGGVCVEMARMRRVLKVDVENRLAVVEAGVVNAQVSRAVAAHGLYYVPDPSSQGSCTVGGNVGENAGGIHCLKYGTTTDHVVGARVVLTDGRVVRLGGAGALAPGYDLLGLFVGSEGTFGVVTEVTVKLTPVAPSVRTLLADFLRLDDASRAVSAVIAEGIIPAGLEMVDGATIRAVEASVFAAGMPTDAEAALLVELDGLEAGLDEEVERVRQICLTNGARTVRLAADELERKKLWAARKGAFGAMGRITPDILIQDAVVPRSRLPEVLAATYRIGARHGLRVANVFHAGDGNLHPLVCFDSRDAEQVRRVHEAGREIMETCVGAGGTITGEHGVGLDKSEYLPLVFTEDDMRAMLSVRAAFDPTGLCNPGKIIPALKGCGEARAVATAGVQVRTSTLPQSVSSTAFDKPSATPPRAHGAFDAGREFAALAGVVGDAHVVDESAVDGSRRPALSVEPATREEACEVLRLASREGWRVMPAGAGCWLDAGGAHADVLLKTTHIRSLVEHEPADLVATAEAGLTLADFNRAVGRAGQWLPLDPPGAGRATLGGVAATGAAGPLALGYGLPRAYVLGMRVALSDGRLIRAGSRVVKNVAGYDLCKLFTGSQGTLGLILELTFKLRPVPARDATLVAHTRDLDGLLAASRELVTSQLLPAAVELLSPPLAHALGLTTPGGAFVLLARFAGNESAVEYQLTRAAELITSHLKDGGSFVAPADVDAGPWSKLSACSLGEDYRHADDGRQSNGDGRQHNGDGQRGDDRQRVGRPLVWRAGVLPSNLGALLSRLQEQNDNLLWHAGAGDGRLRVYDEARGVKDDAARLTNLREAARASGGSLVVERSPEELKQAFDAWGLSESAALLMRRIKRQLDPANILSPGRFRIDDEPNGV